MAVSVIVHECTAVGGGESTAVCVSPATRLKENLFFVFVLGCLCFSDRPKGIKTKVTGMRVVCSFSASRVSCPQDSFTEASFTNYPAYLPYLLLMVKKPGPIHQMKTMGPCFTFAFYSN